MIDTLILIISIGIMNILCFFIGAKVGQKVVKGETLEIPKIEPIRAIREHNEKQEILRLQEKDRIISENIDKYDGTSLGQQDIPKV